MNVLFFFLPVVIVTIFFARVSLSVLLEVLLPKLIISQKKHLHLDLHHPPV